MTKIMLNIVVASMVLSATAGLFDSLKKAGAELIEGANEVVGGVVNASTSVVCSVTTDTTASETDNALAEKLKMFLENELYPQTKRFETALQTRYNGFHNTLWRDGVLPSEGGLCPLKKEVVYDRLVEDFGYEFCKTWEHEMFSGYRDEDSDPSMVAARLLMEPWNDVAIHWNPTNRQEQMTCMFFTKEGRSSVGYYVEDGIPVRFLDRYGTKCEPADTEKWIEVAKGWLAKTREAIDRECFIDGRSLKWFAQAHSETNYSPFSVYKGIALGDSVGAVYSKLKAIDEDAKWTGDTIFKGKAYENYPNGKLLQTEIKTHKLMLVFGSMEENAGGALVFAKITFSGVAPSRDEMIEKYMGLPGAKRLKDERKEVGRKWRDDNVSCFWRTFTEFTQEQLILSAMSGSGERGELTDNERTGQGLLADDLVVINRDHSDGIFVDAAVVESGGATISVRTMSDTGNVADVIIEDRIVAQAMEKKQSEFTTKKAERARLKKESAIKAQKNAAVDF